MAKDKSLQIPDRISRASGPAAVGDKGDKSDKKGATRRGRERAAHSEERNRTSRAQTAQDENELFSRVDEDQPYVRSASLTAPKPMPGMRQRFVRVGMGQMIDDKNLAKKLRDGWRARPSDSIPKTFHVPRVKHGKFAGCVMVEGMLLMHMPEKLAKRRDAAIRADTDVRTKAVNEQLLRVNQTAGGGFGPVKKGESSKQVREVAAQAGAEGSEDEVDLTT